MEQITWTEEFSVGIASFDYQHKRIIAMINSLLSSPEAGTNSETISDLLGKMTSYAIEHFQKEEELLRQHGYPLLEEQIAQHRAFRIKTVDFCTATFFGIDAVPETMLNYLREWFVQHILTCDMSYKPFFQGIGLT